MAAAADAMALAAAGKVQEIAGRVTISASDAVSAYLLPDIIARIRQQPDCFRIVSESGPVIWELVRRGLGVGIMLREIAERTPGIIRLLPDLPGTPVPVWLVSHRELRTSRRVRVVFEILAEELRHCPVGERPTST